MSASAAPPVHHYGAGAVMAAPPVRCADRTRQQRDDERARVNARLDGCEHDTVRKDGREWRCATCDQAFIPLLEQPVLVGDWGKPRLSDASNPEWNRDTIQRREAAVLADPDAGFARIEDTHSPECITDGDFSGRCDRGTRWCIVNHGAVVARTEETT